MFGVPVSDVPVLSRSLHDRVGIRRTDESWLHTAWHSPEAKVLLLSPAATTPVDEHDHLVLLSPREDLVRGSEGSIRVLLGEAGGVTFFALLAADDGLATSVGARWAGLREVAVGLDDLEVGLLTTAVALRAWHDRHTHCPACGSPTVVVHSGWARHCPVDGSDHFPRTDPAVIMLVTDDQQRCLLARSAAWPPGRLSVLAGFVEAGESAEAAVAREVREEVGIEVIDIRYVASQPHPFPSSLMLGFTARVAGDSTLCPDLDEIVDAGWFTREQVRAARDWGTEQQGGPSVMLRALPPKLSIARQMIDAWVADGGAH
jgi:NAD+ diphosphatase